MSKPLSPADLRKAKLLVIPAEMFKIVNELLVQEDTGQSSITIRQEKIVKRAEARIENFEIWMLNIESAYEAAGWEVKYDKRAYNESDPATFTFKRRSKE